MFEELRRRIRSLEHDVKWATSYLFTLRDRVNDMRYVNSHCETLMELLVIISGYSEKELMLLLKAKQDGVDLKELARIRQTKG